jgi:hypothetical protein
VRVRVLVVPRERSVVEMDRHELRIRHLAKQLAPAPAADSTPVKRRLSTLSRDMTGRVALITGAASGQVG